MEMLRLLHGIPSHMPRNPADPHGLAPSIDNPVVAAVHIEQYIHQLQNYPTS